MALVVADRVQETTTTSGTGTLSLGGAVSGYSTFVSRIGSGNTTYYTIYDNIAQVWEVGIGTVTAGAPNTLSRTTVLSNSSGTTSPITLAGNTASVFCTYPAEKSVNLDASGNVTALGTVSSGVWQGTTVATLYGGTGVTTSTGANSNVLRDSNTNVSFNNWLPGYTTTATAAGTTTLTAASSYDQRFTGTTTQTVKLPDATTMSLGQGFIIDNDSTGALALQDNTGTSLGSIVPGMAGYIFCEANGTVAGSWSGYLFVPGAGPGGQVTWGTAGLSMGGQTITNSVWNGSTIGTGYGGTGATATPTNGQLLIGNGTNFSVASLGTGTGISTTTGSGTLQINNTGVTSLAGTSPVSASASTGSVTVSLASGYGDTQNPYASKTANYVLAAPNGSAGVPTFRLLVSADIPALSYVSSVTGTSPVASSGGLTPAISLSSGYGDTQNPYASKTANYVLAAPNGSAGTPSFRALVAADIPPVTNVAGGAANQIHYQTAASTTSFITAPSVASTYLQWTGTAFAWASAGGTTTNAVTFNNGGAGAASGTTFNGSSAVTVSYNTIGAQVAGTYVTSVSGTSPVSSSGGTTPAISLASGYGDTQNPYASKTANYFLAAPNGSAGTPSFRAIVAADIPTLNQNTTGTASNVTGTVAVGNGGTGQTSLTANNVILGNGGSAVQFVAPGTSGNVLTSNGSTWVSQAASGGGATITGTTSNTTYYVVGTSSTSGSLTTASISNTNVVSYNASTGALSAVSHVSSSDESLKTNWRDLQPDFIDQLAEVKHGIFDRIEGGNTEVGVTAQSLQKVLEHAVVAGEDGKLSVNYGAAALVACVQLAKRVLELEAKLKEKE